MRNYETDEFAFSAAHSATCSAGAGHMRAGVDEESQDHANLCHDSQSQTEGFQSNRSVEIEPLVSLVKRTYGMQSTNTRT